LLCPVEVLGKLLKELLLILVIFIEPDAVSGIEVPPYDLEVTLLVFRPIS
jgi:hypothetical protein